MKYQIIEKLIPVFEEKIQKFQRKFGKDSITYSKSEPYLETRSEYGVNKKVKVVDVDIEGHYQITGYEFIASLEYISKLGKNLIKKAPNTEEIPLIFRSRNCCDHCNTNRPRKYTVLLKNKETGVWVQVGKDCLKEYLGVDIEKSAAWFSFWGSFDEYMEEINKSGSFNHHDFYYSIDEVLEQTVAQKNKEGYISKSMVIEWYNKNDPEGDLDLTCPFDTTASVIYTIMTEQKDFRTGELIRPKYEITDEIKTEVQTIKDFIMNSESTDYVNNLKTLMEMKDIPCKELGLAASIVGYYIRETKKEEERRIREELPESEKSQFVGNIGDRITVKGQLECVFSAESEYGMYYIYNFKVGKDNFVWKTSKDMRTDVDLEITGTVKAHNIFKNIRQTEITRVRTKIA